MLSVIFFWIAAFAYANTTEMNDELTCVAGMPFGSR
jgi:hypothetical protein